MTMTNEQRNLIRASFQRVAALGDEAGRLFYRRLFEAAPHLRGMFPQDIESQATKLRMALKLVVDNIGDWPKLGALVDALARRHVGYGVLPEHYALVGEVLLGTLAEALGDDFTPETRDAWTAAYTALAGRMIETAYPRAA